MKDQNNGLDIWAKLLIISIGMLSITGIGVIDGEITRWIAISIGWIAYSVVRWMYRGNLLHTRKDGHNAYSAIVIIVAIIFLGIYLAVSKLVDMLRALPLWAKITIPSAILMIIIGIIIYLIIKNRTEKKKNNMKEVVEGQNDDKKE